MKKWEREKEKREETESSVPTSSPNKELMAIGPFQFTISSSRHSSKLLSLFVFFSFSSTKAAPKQPLPFHSSPRIASLQILRGISSSASIHHRQLRQQQQQQSQRQNRPTQLAATPETLAQKIGKSVRRPGAPSKARVYSDINVVRPKEYWDYESLTVQWG